MESPDSTTIGETDKTYAGLIDSLANKTSDPVDPALQNNVLQFYADPNAQVDTQKNAKAWQTLQNQLDTLQQRAVPPAEVRPPVLNQ